MLVTECVVVLLLWPDQFSASWEYGLARRLVLPIALALFAPASLGVVAIWKLATLAAQGSVPAKRIAAGTAAAAGAALAFGVSNGRHFADAVLRAAFVSAVAAIGGAGVYLIVPVLARVARLPAALAAIGTAIAIGAWFSDALVLPRLYPVFHDAMCIASLFGGGLVGISFRPQAARTTRAGRVFAGVVGTAVVGCAVWAPHAARVLQRASNLRIALAEHAPLLGRGVLFAALLVPPEKEPPSADDRTGERGEIARSLDWIGHDLILLSVDALRADHVSAYGYARPTTPAIDALAREGTLFEAAYCPTPHTSYSLTSMLTGKYLRPLIALGLGEDSETWAQHLRRYGWRTAAFYPPAVFFIDEDSFPTFEREHLGFEYAKVEFADPELRERQVAAYLDGAPAGTPLFLWVHFFEPHEPYVLHADHHFAGGRSPELDAYDGEIAAADDGIGRIVRQVRARRPGAVVIVTADHGEEFREHGGLYHGTTVYEEQVRVPLVVAGPGVRTGARVATVVQTIDLLPTVLSALGIPRPARLRGRDLGPLLATQISESDGFAFAETDRYALIASGGDRLVCERRLAVCALYRPKDDPGERRDLASEDPARVEHLRALLRRVERDHGRYESSTGQEWPEPIRRGMQGETEAAPDVASLLDDADLAVRRKAAEVCFDLHVSATALQLRRALAHDEDDEVRRWSAVALVRIGDPPSALIVALAKGADRDWRRRAALALAERSEALSVTEGGQSLSQRACDELGSWWSELAPVQKATYGRDGGQDGADGQSMRLELDLMHTEELLSATRSAHCRAAVPGLLRALADVRARPFVADTLGALGDSRARVPLLAFLADEPYITTRPHEARALLALGARDNAWPDKATPEVRTELSLSPGPARLAVLLSDSEAALKGSVDGAPLAGQLGADGGSVRYGELGREHGPRIRLELRASAGGIVALWVMPIGRLD
jgi:arylsulfatase A-like enzyme